MPECRLCLKNRSKSKLISIFDVDKDNRKTSEKIHECTSIEINEYDELPKVVCNYCLKNLTVAYRFRQECRRNDSKLRKRFKIIDDEEQKYNPSGDQDQSNHIDDKWALRKNSDDGMNLSAGDNYGGGSEWLMNAVADNKGHVLKKNDLDNGILEGQVLQVLEKNDGLSKGKNTVKNFLKDHIQSICNTNDVMNDVDSDVIKTEVSEDMSSEGEIPSKTVPAPIQDRLQEEKTDAVTGGPRKKYRKSLKAPAYFVCKVCGKVFKSSMGLQGHERRHTGEKPFVCQVCGKSFHVVNELKKHSLVHSGLKPYQCRHCGRSFSDWGSRFKHERCHSGERPYKCEECGKCFAYASVLANHKLTHSGIKNFSCDICEKKFTLKFHLTNHNRKYHPA